AAVAPAFIVASGSSSEHLAERIARRADGGLIALVVHPAGIDLVTARPHEPGLTKSSEVVGHVVLALAERGRHLAHATGTLSKERQHGCPGRVGKEHRARHGAADVR